METESVTLSPEIIEAAVWVLKTDVLARKDANAWRAEMDTRNMTPREVNKAVSVLQKHAYYRQLKAKGVLLSLCPDKGTRDYAKAVAAQELSKEAL